MNHGLDHAGFRLQPIGKNVKEFAEFLSAGYSDRDHLSFLTWCCAAG